jgi:5'-3' exonuclease
LILVDGSSLLHRVLHTPQSELRDDKGFYTGGLHGFLNSLSTAALKHQLKHSFIVAWDSGIPLFRRQAYKEYKPHKEPIGNVPDSLKSEANILAKQGELTTDEFLSKYTSTRRVLHSQFLPLSGCLSIQVTNCEADDIVAYVCNKITDEKIIIYSTDRDLMQLMTSNIEFYDGRDFVTHTVDSIINDNNLIKDCWRKHWLTIRTIAGDPSDGIPGFCGWETAEKYASQLIDLQHNKHYTLYDSLTKLERPAGARVSGYEALKNGHDILLRNWKLMDLRYPIDNKLPIIDEIKTEIATAFIFDINQDFLEDQLHRMGMRAAKTFLSNVIECNIKSDIKEYIRKLVT